MVSHLEIWHLHEILVVILAELFFNKIKRNTMKDTIIKISIHLIIAGFLTNLGYMINHIGGQAIPFDRCSNLISKVNVTKSSLS